MLSKVQSIFILAALMTILGCGDEYNFDEPVVIQPTEISSVEELDEFVKGIQFVGTLPGNQVLTFSDGFGYTETEGLNFIKSDQLSFNTYTIDASFFKEIKGRLIFSYDYGTTETVEFEYALITTFGQIAREYPDDITFSSELEDYLLVFCIGDGKESIEDFITEENYIAEHLAYMSLAPYENSYASGYYFRGDTEPLYSLSDLDGNNEVSSNSFYSTGAFDFFNYSFPDDLNLGVYEFSIQE